MKAHLHRMRGMTLVELMIVVVTVAILASIAIPSYRQYVLRATRTEAKAALLRVQAAQEKFYVQKSQYATTAAELTTAPPGGLGLSNKSENGNYDINIGPDPSDGNQGYVATAIPGDRSGQRQDTSCQLFQIDHTGKRSPEVSDATPCWR